MVNTSIWHWALRARFFIDWTEKKAVEFYVKAYLFLHRWFKNWKKSHQRKFRWFLYVSSLVFLVHVLYVVGTFFTLFFDFSPQEAAAAAAAAETEARHLRALEGLMEVGHSALHKLGRLEEEWGTLLPILIKRIVAQYSDIRWVGL